MDSDLILGLNLAATFVFGLSGGLAASVDVSELAPGEIRSAIDAALELPFFRPRIALGICTTCGRKSKAASERCEACKSPHKLQLYS